jgi:hypothetical protein
MCKQSQVSIKQSAIKKALNINRPITIAAEAWWEEKCISDLLLEVNLQCCRVRERVETQQNRFPATSKEVWAVSVFQLFSLIFLFPKWKFATESEKEKSRRNMRATANFLLHCSFYGIFMRIWWLYCVWTWDFFPFTFQPSLENFLFNWKFRISEWKLLFRDREMIKSIVNWKVKNRMHMRKEIKS